MADLSPEHTPKIGKLEEDTIRNAREHFPGGNYRLENPDTAINRMFATVKDRDPSSMDANERDIYDLYLKYKKIQGAIDQIFSERLELGAEWIKLQEQLKHRPATHEEVLARSEGFKSDLEQTKDFITPILQELLEKHEVDLEALRA